jgi:hypothetical protein
MCRRPVWRGGRGGLPPERAGRTGRGLDRQSPAGRFRRGARSGLIPWRLREVGDAAVPTPIASSPSAAAASGQRACRVTGAGRDRPRSGGVEKGPVVGPLGSAALGGAEHGPGEKRPVETVRCALRRPSTEVCRALSVGCKTSASSSARSTIVGPVGGPIRRSRPVFAIRSATPPIAAQTASAVSSSSPDKRGSAWRWCRSAMAAGSSSETRAARSCMVVSFVVGPSPVCRRRAYSAERFGKRMLGMALAAPRTRSTRG